MEKKEERINVLKIEEILINDDIYLGLARKSTELFNKLIEAGVGVDILLEYENIQSQLQEYVVIKGQKKKNNLQPFDNNHDNYLMQ